MDKVFIQGLVIETRIGIHDWERRVRQRLVIDLEMQWDNARAAQTDDIADTLNYQALCERLEEFIPSRQPLLLETLAEEVAALLLEEFRVPWLRLRITKPDVMPQTQSVGVELERSQSPE